MSDSDNWRLKKPLSSPSPFRSGDITSRPPASPSTSRYDAGKQAPREHHDPTQAFQEGRRIYVGNMPYLAKRSDVESLFASYSVTHIDISIDAFTGRNLSYCFVELSTKQDAERAMERLNGQMFMGRPLKIGPGVPKGGKTREARKQDDPQPELSHGYSGHTIPSAFQKDRRPPLAFEGWDRDDAEAHWKGYADQRRRLYVGGLPQLTTHRAVNGDIQELFKDYQIEAISKRISPNPPRRGNHYYVFVDFVSAEDADHAVRSFNGKHALGTILKVSHARGNSRKVDERKQWDQVFADDEVNSSNTQ
ncbi:hypothetical protein GYMLUDRAFT_42783 [Collybiopsis luxurians FD-317 M1]|uniref:Unplaced genomic scaffold GYMLUscaffold_22, whole genome shotgun sequence n=1 Tax=Collybiopsis luxurians FD-317 M1 TaxID=944289 RepID=A0A0D0CGH6_9AGAR|nr:hypothetical protein GYMLUDRAFT_42783 [Collybiopsis luxurians FD-317 M1]